MPTPRSTVLLIDADTEILKLMELVFAEENIDVITSRDPARGLALLARRTVHCVLLDVHFAHAPECLGFLAALRARPETSAIPVLVTSALTGPEVVAQVLGLGARKFIPKPFYPEEILREVRSACA